MTERGNSGTASGNTGNTRQDADELAEARRHHRAGRLAEAEETYRRVLAAQPGDVRALHYLGVLVGQRGHHAAAEKTIRSALTLAPDYPVAHNSLGNVLQAQGRLADAIASYRRALALRPDLADAHLNLGNALKAHGRLDDAVASYRLALALRPEFAEGHNNLGVALQQQRRLDEAIACYARALVLKPGFGEAHNNLGSALQEQGRLDEAIASYRRALTLNPDNAGAHVNLGLALQQAGQLENAVSHYRKALALQPDYAEAHHNLGVALLLRGDIARGAAEYEWRWRADGFPRLPSLKAPGWGGQELPGRTILLRAEQGLGDAIQFVRYAPLVRARCGRVVLQCPPSLVRLLATSPGVDAVVAADEPLPEVAAYAPLLSLMHLLSTRLETIPATVPYLAVDPDRAASFRERIAAALGAAGLGDASFKVGLVWAGNPGHRNDHNRSLRLAALAPLLTLDGVVFFSLQKEAAASEIAALGEASKIIDLAPALADFADTAVAVSCLDLVIAVDTAVAHLAGALGKKVWTLLPFAPDWRWILGRSDSPWYPSMRLFRQPAPGDWASVIETVAKELRPTLRSEGDEFATAQRHHVAGRLAEAEALYRRILAGDPRHVGALHGLGIALAQRGSFDDAEALINRALSLAPDYAEAHNSLGNVLHARDRTDAATASYRRALSLDPNNVKAHNGLGNALQALGRLDDAAASYRRALAINPNDAHAHNNLGTALQAQGLLDAAVTSHQRAIALNAGYAEAHNNLGSALQALGRLDEAVSSHERALALKSDYREAYNNLGNAYRALGRLDEAAARYRQALALATENAEVHKNLGISLLLKGDLALGAAEYEWRWKTAEFRDLPTVAAPGWDGQELPGQTILLRAEQGLGDAIQFVRYAPLVRARCGRVVLQCPASLVRLLATSPGVDAVVAADEPLPEVAAYAPLLSLMHLLGTRLETIPATVPYLAVDPDRVAAFQARIGAEAGVKVGLVWAGNPKHKNNHNRSLALAALAPLLAVEGVAFFSLQKGAPADEIAAPGEAPRLIDLAPALADFADTAAAVSCLDLVIAVDTAVAHLAGALGKKVWTLLPFAPDWRWLLDRDDSPWYPSMRLFRQPAPGDWASVVEAVAKELRRTLRSDAVEFATAQRHHVAGRLAEAEALYRRILAADPDHIGALRHLGVAALQRGEYGSAETLIRRALALAPNQPEIHDNLGNTLQAQGRLEEGVACYRRALALKPDYAQAHYNLGVALQEQGHRAEAIASYRRALALKPDYHEAHYNLGVVLQAEGRLEDALASYRRTLDLKPGYTRAHNNLGSTLRELGQTEAAIASYERALALEPNSTDVLCNLAGIAKAEDRLHDAEEFYRRALVIQPEHAKACNNLGNTLQSQGRLGEAEALYRRALAIRPDYAGAYNNLGATLKRQGRVNEAAGCYERALAIRPDFAEALNNLGNVLQDQGRLAEAVSCYNRALAIRPDYAEAHGNLGSALTRQGWLDEAVASYRRALAIRPDYSTASGNLLMCLQYDPAVTPEALADAHLEFGRRFGAPPNTIARHDNDPDPDRQLRVGYVSADFGRHPVGYFLAPILAAHDRDRFSVYCYSARTIEDDVTARCKAAAAEWRPIFGLPDDALARQIRADGIDVLVDLAGHTGENRLRCLALKPAPVQVTWLGYPGTTGLRGIDYRLTDAIADPQGAADTLSSETLVRLPHGFLCYEPQGAVEVVAPPSVALGQITFGSFNNLSKINPAVVALWARLLHRVPGSRLLLKSLQTADPATWERYGSLFRANGIAPDRVEALSWLPSSAENLDAYARVDVALDPFPYNGTTTTCDALWMGVPVVTLAGDRHAARVGMSILTRLGLSELIAESPDSYVELAARLASDPTRLITLRRGLRDRFRASPLHDAAGLARDIESAYRAMWRRWCSGSADGSPAPLGVPTRSDD